VEGLVHHEFLVQCQTMNQIVFITILQCLWDAVHRKRPRKWSSSTLASAPRQCAVPRGPEFQGILGQAQHPRGFHGRITGITAYNLEGHNLKEITWVTCRCCRFPTINSVPDIFDQPSFTAWNLMSVP
jgi:hypothetical protein